MTTSPTLGTLLRQLIDALDGAVEQAYVDAGLDYRPRYTPIVRALLEGVPATMRALSKRTRVTHSAIGQTVKQMVDRGWVTLEIGGDARERIVTLTPRAKRAVPKLRQLWATTEMAARTLDEGLGLSLPEIIAQALRLLEELPFSERLRAASDSISS